MFSNFILIIITLGVIEIDNSTYQTKKGTVDRNNAEFAGESARSSGRLTVN
jgi:hypothetical protein